MKPNLFDYYINLNERGSFYADIRNINGETVFEIKSEDDGTIWMIEDGFMKHIEDLQGLKQYLISVGILNNESLLRFGN